MRAATAVEAVARERAAELVDLVPTAKLDLPGDANGSGRYRTSMPVMAKASRQ